MSFKQAIPAIGLSVEEVAAESEPAQFVVTLRDEVLLRSSSKRKAIKLYDQKKAEIFAAGHRPEREPFDQAAWLAQQKAQYDLAQMRSEWLQRFGTKSRKGGKGGRGGI